MDDLGGGMRRSASVDEGFVEEESCVLPSVLVTEARRAQSDDDDPDREIWERTAYIDNRQHVSK